MSDLTPRQLAVLRLVAKGYRDTEISAELFVCQRTAKNDIARIRQVLGARNNAHAVAIAHATRILVAAPADALPASVVLELVAERMGYRIALVPLEDA